MAKATPDLSYCGQEVRKYDNDRFLAALFAPADRREALFALYAFNVEIAKTREVVSEPLLGQMRLQFWRDGIESIYATGIPPKHGVMEPLAEAIARYDLPRSAFDQLIDAREDDLEDVPPMNLDALDAYCERTSAPLTGLALSVLGVHNEEALVAARHASTGYALTGILRAVPYHAAQHHQMLPEELMARHGVKQGDLFNGNGSADLNRVVVEVANRAAGHIKAARKLRRHVPRAGLSAFLPAVLADLHLGVLARELHDVFAVRSQMPHPFRQARMAWAALTGRW